jgi:GxxExxY protein
MLTKVSSKLPDALEDLVYRSIGCALEVHKRLGPGYGEPIYQKAMRIELAHQGLQFEREPAVMIKIPRSTAAGTGSI